MTLYILIDTPYPVKLVSAKKNSWLNNQKKKRHGQIINRYELTLRTHNWY